jgi:hypothetical protein
MAEVGEIEVPVKVKLVMDWDGDVIQFADVANSGVAVGRETGSRGGNSQHDSRSGKFAPGGGKPAAEAAPPNADPEEFKRYLDSVRDAARLYGDLPGADEIQDFIAGRAKDPKSVDVEAFLAAVQAQRETDILDSLYNRLAKASNTVKITVPEEMVASAFANIEADAIERIAQRLIARGLPEEKVTKLIEKYSKEEEGSDPATS